MEFLLLFFSLTVVMYVCQGWRVKRYSLVQQVKKKTGAKLFVVDNLQCADKFVKHVYAPEYFCNYCSR